MGVPKRVFHITSGRMPFWLQALIAAFFWGLSSGALSLTANQVAFEFRPGGTYRVYVHYTVPALKEFRDAYIEFTSRREAEKFYFDLLRGADFYLDDPDSREFINTPQTPVPW